MGRLSARVSRMVKQTMLIHTTSSCQKQQASRAVSRLALLAALPIAGWLALGVTAKKDAFGQSGLKAPASQPLQALVKAPLAVTGTGEQMRAIAAVCGEWKNIGEKARQTNPYNSPDLRDYTFQITQKGEVYTVMLSPKKPVVEKVMVGKRSYWENKSWSYAFTVRSGDFKAAYAGAIKIQ